MENFDFNFFGLTKPLPSFENLRNERAQLPVTRQLAEFKDLFLKNDVLILSSGTGSGKTTQIPPYVAFLSRQGKIVGKIACTQPRRLAVTRVSERVAQEAGCKLGAQVGYRIRGEDRTSGETRLIYMTDGRLVAQAYGNISFAGYHTIIIDEAHEYNANICLLLSLVRRAIQLRRGHGGELKVVIMSATIGVDKFVKYFEGQAKPNVPDFVEAACRMAAHIVENKKMPPGNILVFMPGVPEVNKTCRRLQNNVKGVQAIPLYSGQLEDVQNDIFEAHTGCRKCIVATNLAETGITIPDVVFVIDTGKEKVLRWMPRLGASEVRVRPTAKANAMQRMGRCGRTRPGVCFRLYTSKDYDDLRDEPAPEILNEDVTPIFLKALAFGFTAANLPFIDQPPTECVLYAVELLFDLGYVNQNLEITDAGKLAAGAPFEPNWAYAIYLCKSEYPECAMHVVALAALHSSMHSIFVRPSTHLHEAYRSLDRFVDPMSDHLTQLNALYAYENMESLLPDEDELNHWCWFRFLNRRELDNALYVRDMSIKSMNIDTGSGVLDTQARLNVRKILAQAFFRQTALRRPSSNEEEVFYRTIHGNHEALLGLESVLKTGAHPWIVYSSFKLGQNPYLEQATAIDPRWIVDLPYFQDDRLKRNWNGDIVQTQVKNALDATRAVVRGGNEKKALTY
ncbi:hypothetical protein QQS21_004768 [Conoideocrella luteorostrata]|uniref:RNA helicase n=1 Tax=Conoideocrella luteorostrata TaxID=1105319 RepID=A0AAJ0FUE0_9HYPO|nr:hypothetical protein QQS21_004768 [Conoideocrella luteorostrata]